MPIYDIRETQVSSGVMDNNATTKNYVDEGFKDIYDKLELTKNELACMIDREDDRIDKVFNRIASTKNDLRKLQTSLTNQIVDLDNRVIEDRIHCESFEAHQHDKWEDHYEFSRKLIGGMISWGATLTILVGAIIMKLCGVF